MLRPVTFKMVDFPLSLEPSPTADHLIILDGRPAGL